MFTSFFASLKLLELINIIVLAEVIAQSDRNYKPTPTIMLKGQWVNEMGFEIGDQMKVECEDGKLVIILDREGSTEIEAKQVFLETEMKKLQTRYEKEKKEICAKYIAEYVAKYRASTTCRTWW